MIEDYLAIALQMFKKHFLNTLINIGGLAIGMAACILILLHIQDELSFDRQFTDYDRIYRVEQRMLLKGANIPILPTLSLAGSRELESFGSPIEAKTSMVSLSRVVRFGEEQNFEQIMFMEANFFDVFDFSSLIDDPKRVLANASRMMISQKMADKYFPDDDPIGKVLTVGNEIDYEVVGVFPALPKNIHIQFDFITLLDRDRDIAGYRYNWAVSLTYSYIKLEEGAHVLNTASRLDDFLREAAHRQWPRGGTVNFSFVLTPLADIHLYSESRRDMIPPGDIRTVMTFGIVAVLILTIASINYINLTTSRASQRAREVSIRKALGATRGQLITQFLTESVVLTFVALGIALILVVVALPWFNNFLYKELQLSLTTDPLHGILTLSVVFLVGFIGGLYPAFVLSSFRPAQVLRANQSTATGSSWLRNSLVIVQYVVSIALILITALIVEQTNFARQFDLGFDTKHKINISVRNSDAQPYIEPLMLEFARMPEVTGTTMMRYPFPGAISYLWEMSVPQFAIEGGQRVANYEVDDEFFSVFGIEPIAGRVFSTDFQADYFVPPDQRDQRTIEQQFKTGSIVVNESLLDMFGIPNPESALGTRVYIEPQNTNRNVEAIIIGVVEDTHFESIHSTSRGGYFSLRPRAELGAITLAVETNNLQATMQEVDRIWYEIIPDVPITRRFVDTLFNSLYVREEHRGKLFSYFAFLAIVLSCLGLYGLSSFAASRRRKEISVRKVLGASVWDIVLLLLIQFAKPVLIASLIGLPIAFIFINDWLQGFAYRIDVYDYAYLFPAVFLLLLLIAWATVSFHAVQAARLKPIVALRTE